MLASFENTNISIYVHVWNVVRDLVTVCSVVYVYTWDTPSCKIYLLTETLYVVLSESLGCCI
jgi:hypothetical protein